MVGQRTPAYYRVTVDVEPRLAQHWLAWMLDEHVPDVLKQPGFMHALVLRDLERECRFVVEYILEDRDALDAYLNGEAVMQLRAAHDTRYAGKVKTRREVLEPLAEIAVRRDG
jgi:quinol monooxygenase YgiN